MRGRDTGDVLGLGTAWPRPGWAVLDAAREQGFTGAIEFQTTPVVRAHLDRGRLYVAERVTDPPLGARLVDAGALSAAELEQGVVRIDGVEHLGRLFERVPTVDRHRVLVVLELMTDEAARWVATQLVRGITTTPYEHHPSGVHRWEAEPEQVAPVVRGAPLPAPVPGTAHFLVPEPGDVDELADEVRIEWADAAWMGSERTERRAVRSLPVNGVLPPVEAEPVMDEPVLAEPLIDRDVAVAFAAAAADEVVDGFEVIWPTGEVQRELTVPVVEPEPVIEQIPTTWNIRMPMPTTEPPPPDLVDELADEVALAVRRAIASITQVDVTAAPEPPVDEPEPEGTRIVRSSTLSDEEAGAARRLAEPALEPAPPITPPAGQASVGPAPGAAPSPTISPAPLGAPWLPERTGVARPAPTEERKSALRRLISGLRRR